MPKATVIILSTREEELKKCLESLRQTDEQNIEIIINTEQGNLTALRNKCWRKATSPIVIFIDDDTVVTKTWLAGILSGFSDPEVGGVTGPSVIPDGSRQNRDIFRFKKIKRLYDWFFLEGKASLPGHIVKSGAWTTGACSEACTYEGGVHFLEACNMAYRKDALWAVDGFDESYGGVGDWSEPDLSFKIRKYLGYKLLFKQDAKLYHLPSKSGAYGKRIQDRYRLLNYFKFAERWVKPTWKHIVYLIFLRIYFWIKRHGYV